MTPRTPPLTIPKPAAEIRATRAARQKRWRDRRKALATPEGQVAAAVDYAAGLTTVKPPPLPDIPRADLAKMMRDRVFRIVSEMPDEAFLDKDFAPIFALGLKAESQMEGREKTKAKQQDAQLGWAILAMLQGRPPPALTAGGEDIIDVEALDLGAAE